ncbi:MAG: glycosyltransferase family 4 protein, partial [Odoribacteraceae bacterium]|nr:glycosyltransferase family 4 protein [Odoribacteraceae bacterium]
MHEKKIKVAYFLGRLNRGGMETLLLDLLHLAGEAPGEMMVIYREEGNVSGLFRATGVKMVKINFRGSLDLPAAWRTRRLLRREGVDIVHAQHPLEAFRAWIASAGTRVRVVMTLHGYDFHQSRAGAIITRWMLRRTRLNFFVSEAQRRYYERKYHLDARRQTVLYNGIRLDKLAAPGETGDFRRPGAWLLGMVGSFNAGRDQMVVCRFLTLLKEAGVPFRFLFAGHDATPSGEACKRYCREHRLEEEVAFLGTQDDVPGILSRLDAFIYATSHDTFGIAVAEAIAAGLPAFVNDWEVMREITEGGALATLYRTGDEA